MAGRPEVQENQMKCLYCQSEMKKGSVPFHIDRNGVHVTLDEVPAWVCTQCGEPYFEENEVDYVQSLVNVVEEQAQKFAGSA
jgi:YgiT-type zinc finger domain-containing protein